MKVALVTQPADGVLPPRQNSIGLIFYNTALAMGARADVTLYMKRRDDVAPAADLPFAVRMVDAGLDDIAGRFAARHPRWAGRFGLGAVADDHPHYVRSVRAALDAAAPDVVHLVNYWGWCRRLGRRGRPLVLEMQSEWLSQMPPDEVRHQLGAADAVVAVSDHVAQLFRRAIPDYAGLVDTVYNGVDTDIFRPAETPAADDGERRILFVGRVSPEKGIHTLIEAFGEICRRHPGARLALAGPRTILPHRYLVGLSDDPRVRSLSAYYDGTITRDYQHHLDALVIRGGMTGRVEFLGPLPHHELVSRYRNAHVVVNPSYSETFGISIVEGMACGIPVVGTRIGGMQETIVDGRTGLLVEAGEADALADAVCRLLDRPDHAAALAVAGRERAKTTFSWRARAQRLLDVYHRLAQGR